MNLERIAAVIWTPPPNRDRAEHDVRRPFARANLAELAGMPLDFIFTVCGHA
jgi:hypothetical protein